MTFLQFWSKFSKLISNLLFWGFNVPLAFTVLNWGGVMVWNGWREANLGHLQIADLWRQLTQFIPADIVVTLLIFFAMPVVVILVVLLTKSYRQPTRLLQILFGVELPIMAFTLGRLVFLKTLTPVNSIFLISAGVSIAAYIIYIFHKPAKNKFLIAAHLLAHQLAVIMGGYASLLMFFFLPIACAWVIQAIGTFFRYDLSATFRYSENFWQIITGLMGMAAFGSLFLALVSSPFVGLLLYWRATRRLSKLLQAQTNFRFAQLTQWLFGAGYALTIIVLAYQGSLFGFYNQMASYQGATTFEQRSAVANQILKQESFVADRLVNVYLANYRYLTDSSMNLLQQAYVDQMKLDEPAAKQVQTWFTTLASPFVYNGKFDEDVKRAGDYYQEIFDEPIQLAESQKVSQTLASSFNFSSDQMKSSVLDRADEDVRLVKKIITAQPDPTQQFATVTIEEEYENTTAAEQEVLYVFSLPQDSVMTDLKLGADLELAKDQLELAQPAQLTPSPAAYSASPAPGPSLTIPQPIAHKDQGEVAAKGAADQTFEDQYRRRMDPAILEQVGPVQYKLRVYPIPVKEQNLGEWQRENLREPVKNQKVRYSYVTALDAQGQAALPKMTETRNVFSNAETIFTYQMADGTTPKITPQTASVPVLARTESTCGSQSAEFAQGGYVTMFVPHSVNPWLKNSAIPFDCQNQLAGAEQKVTNKRIAILADASYSMGVKDWHAYLSTELPLNELLDKNVVDLYYFNNLVSQPVSLNQQRNNPRAWTQVAFGKTDRLKALQQIAGKYDAVIMFTDGSEADEPGSKNFVPTIAQPIYVVHANGTVPKLPDNLTYYLQANGARVVVSGREALQNFAAREAVTQQVQNAFVVVGESGTWLTLPVSTPALAAFSSDLSFQTVSANEPLAKLALHRQIESEMRDRAANLDQLSVLDNLNKTAQASGIVTPFSSFIVLTTDAQRAQLKQASLSEDRFVVDYNLGEEQLIQPTAGGLLGTSAVPEPHEWALLVTGLGLVTYLGRHRVKAWLVHRNV